jgi:hypothetical protein
MFLQKFCELRLAAWRYPPEDNTLHLQVLVYILEKNNGSFHSFVSLFKILEWIPACGYVRCKMQSTFMYPIQKTLCDL